MNKKNVIKLDEVDMNSNFVNLVFTEKILIHRSAINFESGFGQMFDASYIDKKKVVARLNNSFASLLCRCVLDTYKIKDPELNLSNIKEIEFVCKLYCSDTNYLCEKTVRIDETNLFSDFVELMYNKKIRFTGGNNIKFFTGESNIFNERHIKKNKIKVRMNDVFVSLLCRCLLDDLKMAEADLSEITEVEFVFNPHSVEFEEVYKNIIGG